MSKDQFEQVLQRKLDELPREIQPQRNLWPGIDLAIEHQQAQSSTFNRWTGIAASFAVLGLVIMLSMNTTTDSQTDKDNLRQLISNVSEQHEQQKQFLLTSYSQQPALTDNWQDQLRELDEAATVIKSALEEDPGDANLIELLQQVYQQQIKLIQSVHQSRWL